MIYEVDQNLKPLQRDDLSLFDLLYFLSKTMADEGTFRLNDNVFAFQVAALVFRGGINQVNDNLRSGLPLAVNGLPETENVARLCAAARSNVVASLEPMMEVSAV